MSKSCERCGKDFVPRTYSQRFCTSACSDAFYVEERREALTKLRGEETSTYHSIAEADADAPGAAFNPKKRDIDEVLDALRMEALVEDRFIAPCWLPGGEPAGEWIVCRNGSSMWGPAGRTRIGSRRTARLGSIGTRRRSVRSSMHIWRASSRAIWSRSSAVEWLGLCMTHDTFPHKGMLLLGERRAGKSTFLRLMEQLVSREGYVAYTFESLVKSELSPHGMIGKRVIAFPDVRLKQGQQYGKNYDAGGLSHEARGMLLRITEVDTVSFRLGYSAARWEGALPGKVIIVSNEFPTSTMTFSRRGSSSFISRWTKRRPASLIHCSGIS